MKRAHSKTTWILTAIFLLLACIFQFALIGYQTIVLLCLGLAAFTLLWGLLYFRWFHRVMLLAMLLTVLCIGMIEIPIVAASFGDEPADTEYIIVLGAGVNGTTPSLSLQNRLITAQRWLEDHPDSKAILSGGQGPKEDISEAQCMYQWLTHNGIAPERLLMEEQSTSTKENFLYSARLLLEHNNGVGSNPVAVVSSEYHLYRAKYLAKQAGLDMLGVPAKTTLPVLRINYFLRESAAVARLWILGY